MPKTSKPKESPKVEKKEPIQAPVEEVKAVLNLPKETENIPEQVKRLMRLYKNYEEFWVTKQGFVHPVGVPESLTKDAKLYKNIYYNQ